MAAVGGIIGAVGLAAIVGLALRGNEAGIVCFVLLLAVIGGVIAVNFQRPARKPPVL